MSRKKRPHLPGVPFHLTARLHRREPLFAGFEAHVVRLIRDAADRSPGQLLAHAVMANHVHLVFVQGRHPLAEFVRPLLTRVALFIRRQYGRKGYILERRYRASACLDALYLRNALAYVSLNPVRHGVCDDPGLYAWTSHAAMLGHAPLGAGTDAGIDCALRMFAPRVDASRAECISRYRRFLEWRVEMDRASAAEAAVLPDCPDAIGGDEFWMHAFGAACYPAAILADVRPPLPDLRDVIRWSLQTHAPAMSLDTIRAGGRGRALVRIRDEVIKDALRTGHRGTRIAMFLNISPQSVSKRKMAMKA